MSQATKQQIASILQLQGQLGASRVFIEPKFIFGEHPHGWSLTSKNADEILGILEAKVRLAPPAATPQIQRFDPSKTRTV